MKARNLSRLTLAALAPTLDAMTFPTAFWAWWRRERGGSVA